MCHPTCFIQNASLFILSFDVKSKMTTDMFLPVILPELVDSDDEKPCQGKTQEWIKRRHQLGSFRDHHHNNVTFCAVLICPQNKVDSRSNFQGYKNIFGCAGKKKTKSLF